MALQRQIEHAAYAQTGAYRAPCQRVGDFLADRPTKSLGAVEPTYPVGVEPGRAAASLPDFAQTMLRDSLPYFGRKIRGYDAADALLTGPETRTSSPVRMKRGEDLFGLGVRTHSLRRGRRLRRRHHVRRSRRHPRSVPHHGRI